jgi:acyl carrier protein
VDEQAVRERVRALTVRMAPLRLSGEVTSASLLMEDLGYDSLGIIEVATALEEEFGLTQAASEDVADVETVGDVEDRLLALLDGRVEKGTG